MTDDKQAQHRHLCLCGCGHITPIAPETRYSRGWVRGNPMPYAPHHRKNRWPVSDGVTKQCRYCRKELSISQFHVNKRNSDGKQHFCKTCSKAHSYGYRAKDGGKVRFIVIRLKSRLLKFKITPQDYERMLLDQNHTCAICRKPERVGHKGKPRRLSIDHDHVTGKIRGLLCVHCNQAIGKLRDSPDLLRAAAAYIERNQVTP